MVDMRTRKFKHDDYLLEIKVCLEVRKEDAPALIALGPNWRKDKTEDAKLSTAISHLIDKRW
jgi:hypothetical protein